MHKNINFTYLHGSFWSYLPVHLGEVLQRATKHTEFHAIIQQREREIRFSIRFTINYLLGVFPFSWVCLVQNVTASWYKCLKQIKPGQKNILKGRLKLKPFNYQSKVEDISSKHQAFIQSHQRNRNTFIYNWIADCNIYVLLN